MGRAGLDELPRLRRVGAAAAGPGHRRAADAQPARTATTSRRWGRTSPDYWHLFVEAKKLAFADRAKFYADPTFAKVPVDELISKAYADAARAS